MKSLLPPKPESLTTLATIAIGDVFEFNWEVYIRTNTVNNANISCLEISSGLIKTFNDAHKVIPRPDVYITTEKVITKMLE